MRQTFIEAENLEEAKKKTPWAAIVVEVEGGFMAFESVQDYETWTKQK